MSLEQFANNAATTLNGALDNSTTSVVVTSATSFPAVGDFRILIDSEIMRVTSVSGSTFTVVRAQEGTSAASHLDAAAVTHILTAASVNRYVLSAFTPPVSTDFSWVNQGGATVAQAGAAVVLSVPASASKENRIRVKTAPSTPYTITAHLRAIADPSNFWNFGLLFRESGSGKHHAFCFSLVTSTRIGSVKFTDPQNFSANYRDIPAETVIGYWDIFLRIADTGALRKCSYGIDGTNFQEFDSQTNTDFLTADQVGFFGNSQNSLPMTIYLMHWLQG